jgi:branched-chain amino acid transport system permease protein
MTVVWSGLGIGAVYALVALMFNIVLAGSNVFNFAQPQFIMVGAFLGYVGLGEHDLPLVLVLIGAAAIGALIGILEERIAIAPLRERDGNQALVTTVGWAVTLQGLALVIWGSNPRSVPFPLESKTLNLFGGRVGALDLLLIGLAIVVGVALHVTNRRTSWGLANRAATADPEATAIRGVNVNGLRIGSFALAGALACAIGTIIGAKLTANTALGNQLVILGFTALAVGGFGVYLGALAGGLLLGVIQQAASFYLGSKYELLILFGVLIIVLLVRPTGIFGRGVARSV